MSETPLNYLAIVVSAVAYFMLGGFWYSKAGFGKPWMKLVGKTEAELRKVDPKKAMGFALLSSFIMAFSLAYLTQKLTAISGMSLGLLLGIGFIATFGITNGLFHDKPIKLLLIDTGYAVVGLVIMSLILSSWR